MDNAIGAAAFSCACAALDWARGRSWARFRSGEIAFGLWIGLWAGYFFGAPSWFGYTFALLFALGAVPGWGHPIGRALGASNPVEPERWQYHRVLVDSIPLALAVRGLIWAVPVLPLAYWVPQVLWTAVVMPIAFTAAPYVSKELFAPTLTRWQQMEAVRGALVGLGFAAVFLLA
jgi:hypothetical protein